MYEEHFGFSGSPFRLNPDPKFFFGSRSHNKAMAYLHYGLRQGEGFIVISGEIGAGKSMLIGHLLDQLDRSNVIAANLLTTNLEPSALLAHILSAFRIEPAGAGRTAEIEAFEDFLFDQMNRGRRVLLIVDEAQNLPIRTIEELRMLSNMDYEGTPLFQVFLVGQPEFRSILSKPDMEQFRQRVIASYHLEPLAVAETRDYIEHRLSLVGWRHNPHFTDGAFEAIHEATGGLPRKINKLCNRVLLHCSLEKLAAVDEAAIEAVVSDLKEESFERSAPVVAAEPAGVESEALAAEAEDSASVASAGGAPVVIPFGTPRKLQAKPATLEATPAAAPDVEPPAPAAPVAQAAQPRHVQPKRRIKKPKDESLGGRVMIAKETAPGAEATAPVSALDKLRAMRAEAAATKSPSADSAATLADVRTAVEAAAAGEAVEFDELSEEIEQPLIDAGDIKSWRQSVVRSIDETRQELKSAYANVARLRRQLADIERRRVEKREKISAGLSRAESILSEMRNLTK
jgi:putative secretion ATPase (PEP-CTERM system associated)